MKLIKYIFISDGGETIKERYIRMTVITTRFVALFIVPAYSAFILSFILYPNVKLPFEDMKGLVKDKTYKLGFSTQEGWDDWFRVSL